MQIEFSKHAKHQILERELDTRKIEETLSKPGQIIESLKERKIAQRIYKREGQSQLLRVIFVDENSGIKVISAYWTSKINKYWR